jgi:hypothetical protein
MDKEKETKYSRIPGNKKSKKLLNVKDFNF